MRGVEASRPVLGTGKLFLLLLSTLTIFQFYWLYRISSDLASRRQLPWTPWHWCLVPLLGPFALFPLSRLARELRQWREDDDAELGHMAEPVQIAVLWVVAFLPLLYLLMDTEGLWATVMLSALLLCLPYLALNAQLSLIVADKEGEARVSFSAANWAALAPGTLGSIAIYLFLFTDIAQNFGTTQLIEDQVIAVPGGKAQITLAGGGWRMLSDSQKSPDASVEFVGPDDYTWSVVYDSSDFDDDVDGLMAFRINSIKETYQRANCTQTKTLDDATWSVIGRVECRGQSPLVGDYVYVSNVVRREEVLFEILASTSQFDRGLFAERQAMVVTITKGLEIL